MESGEEDSGHWFIWNQKIYQGENPVCSHCGRKAGEEDVEVCSFRVCGVCQKTECCSNLCMKADKRGHSNTCKRVLNAVKSNGEELVQLRREVRSLREKLSKEMEHALNATVRANYAERRLDSLAHIRTQQQGKKSKTTKITKAFKKK